MRVRAFPINLQKVNLRFLKKISIGGDDHILQITGGHPYFTQYLCFEIWDLTQKKVTSSLIEQGSSICVGSQSYIYEMLLDQIKSKDHLIIGGW